MTELPRRSDYTTPVARRSIPAAPITQQPSPAGPQRRFIREPDSTTPSPLHSHHPSKLQVSLTATAILVFIIGLGVSLQGWQANHNATAQVSALSKQADKSGHSSVPATDKPTPQAISQYVVAPALPRYLRIPKLGVNARVMQTGVTTSGALGTPNNVYDTAWYTGSAKPGQPGATLIDGHVSSWTTHGVFYNILKLLPGDNLQIVRGDGAILNYQVVKTQTYDVNHVDMQAAINPISAGKAGLNLITCAGQVKKGTSQFSQRVIVFAQQL
jgi:sortase (surface protein transpeptidase)